jgi:hypothetical protein
MDLPDEIFQYSLRFLNLDGMTVRTLALAAPTAPEGMAEGRENYDHGCQDAEDKH